MKRKKIEDVKRLRPLIRVHDETEVEGKGKEERKDEKEEWV